MVPPHSRFRRSGARSRFVPRLAALLAVALSSTGDGTASVDCFPDRVASLIVGTVSSPPAFNTWQPGVVLGPPGESTPISGSLTVVSLGHGGVIVVEFRHTEIIDGPGPDFIVFENAFFCGVAPASAADDYSVFAEPGIVAVSENGIDFVTFPFDATALAQVSSLCTDRTLIESLDGLIGVTPSFSGDYRIPDDPLIFDPGGPGGVSGHGGNAFDLADLGMERARFVRITDPDIGLGLPGASEGLDVDAVVALHARPLPAPGAVDGDADGLSDSDETLLYGTNPGDDDSDGDLMKDGEEVATCRDPGSAGGPPWFYPALSLEVYEPSPTVFRWQTLGPGVVYDVVRAGLAALQPAGGDIDLGVVLCVENDSSDLSHRGLGDATDPAEGEAFVYLARQDPAGGGIGYGFSSAHLARLPASGDCP
jgi:hypothetical protein